jgi:hypothetical protein
MHTLNKKNPNFWLDEKNPLGTKRLWNQLAFLSRNLFFKELKG